MRGVDGSMVHGKRSRRYYRVSASIAYEEEADDQDMKSHLYWDYMREIMIVSGHMHWFLRKVSVHTEPHFVQVSHH